MASFAPNFKKNGCAVIPGFAGPAMVAKMKMEILGMVNEWKDAPPASDKAVFRTDEEQTGAQGAEDYFISSGDKVRFFWEAGAEQKRLQGSPEKTLLQLNKIGHGLHELEGSVFNNYAHSKEIRNVVKTLGWKDPVLPQSMYIVKNPRIGGEVTAHQDSSFLYTEPRPTCLGLWLALDNADLENGCLWYRPESHIEPVRRHFQRCDTKDGTVQMDFEQLVPQDQMTPLEGKAIGEGEQSEEKLRELGFIPVPCKAGDLVLIHGQVEHLSLPNTSGKPRHSFQLHLVEGPGAGITWSKRNWLQYSDNRPFSKL